MYEREGERERKGGKGSINSVCYTSGSYFLLIFLKLNLKMLLLFMLHSIIIVSILYRWMAFSLWRAAEFHLHRNLNWDFSLSVP